MSHSLHRITSFILRLSLFLTPGIVRQGEWPKQGRGLKRLGTTGSDHEDGSNRLLRKAGNHLPIKTMSHCRKLDLRDAVPLL